MDLGINMFWDEVCKGNIESLGKVYDLYIDDLYSYGMNLLQDEARVKDAIQELFLDVYKYRKKLAKDINVKSYLLVSLKRKLFYQNALDKKTIITSKMPVVSAPTFYEDKAVRENEEERYRHLEGALLNLTSKQQKILQLKFYEDKSYEEMASIMNLSVPSARTLLYRTMLALKKSLFLICLIFFKIKCL